MKCLQSVLRVVPLQYPHYMHVFMSSNDLHIRSRRSSGGKFPVCHRSGRSQDRSCGICGGHCGTGAGFLRVLRFPLTIIPSAPPHSSLYVIRGWYNRLNCGRRIKWTQSHPFLRNCLLGPEHFLRSRQSLSFLKSSPTLS
jgi:hypothetical protein